MRSQKIRDMSRLSLNFKASTVQSKHITEDAVEEESEPYTLEEELIWCHHKFEHMSFTDLWEMAKQAIAH